MLKSINKIICLLLYFCCNKSIAQSYGFNQYGVDEGLPYIQVYALHQDNKGYLWSGGYGGLSYFDGKKFEVFGPAKGLSNHWVTSITQAKNKTLWVGTIDGLCSYADNKFKVFKTENNLFNNYVNNVFTDFSGKVWIATRNGINYIENDEVKKIESSLGNNVQCVYVDVEGFIWAGTTNGLFKYSNNGKLILNLTTNNGLPNNNVTAIKQDLNGKMIVGTKNGLVFLTSDGTKQMVFSITTGLFDPNITSLLVDYKNNIWIGTNTGLIEFTENKFSYLQLNGEAISNKIYTLSLDYESNIWIGTGNGLFKFRPGGIVNYGFADGLKNPFIYQILNDNSGGKWICTESGGVYYYDGVNFKNYSVKEGFSSQKVTTAFVLDEKRILFGTETGYSILSNIKIQNFSTQNGFNLPNVNYFFRDSKNRIWAGAKNAVGYLIEDENKNLKSVALKLPSNDKETDVWCFEEDDKGNVWIGTYLGGLFVFDGKEIKEVLIPENKSRSFLDFAMVDGKYLFSSTLEGVFMINTQTKEIKYISEKDGLNSNLNYAILATKDKKTLWAGTNQGINKINLQQFLTTGKADIITFGKLEGLQGVECNSHGLFEDVDGSIWIGTVNGLSKFNTANYIPNSVKPKLNLTSVKLFYTDTILNNKTELPYYLNNISFNYIGVCLTNPAKVKYVCKLEGFDKNWSPETTDNFKTYSNLPPGSYTFKVRSCNNEGVWNDNALTVSFKLLNPWYTAWWFILLIVLFALTVLFVIFRIRLNQEKKRQKAELQMHIEISKNELKALRAQINPHFIFNSLNSIQHFIIENDNEEASRYLNKFAKLFRMILNNSEKSTVSIREEIDMLEIYLQLESMRFQNKFEYEFIIDATIETDYEEMPTMLLQPYIENAILHGLTPKKEKGKLTVKITANNSFLVCSIEDNGIGRKRAGEIRTSQKATDKHRSLGMKITQDRLTLLNSINNSDLSMAISDLFNENGDASGTKVDIYIPIT